MGAEHAPPIWQGAVGLRAVLRGARLRTVHDIAEFLRTHEPFAELDEIPGKGRWGLGVRGTRPGADL